MISGYSTLKQSVVDWLARADLTGAIPTFIQLAEARINRDVRTRQTQSLVEGAAVAGVITLPADLRTVQSLHLACGGGWREIHPLPPESLSDETGQGIAHGYVVIDGDAHLIGGASTDGYRLLYHKGVPALSDAAPTNWLLSREPGVYLYGTLIEASPYVADDARTLLWATQYKAIVDRMQGEDEMARYGNGPRMRAGFNAP